MSLVEQEDSGFTWLVVDDSSNDGTAEWLRQVSRSAPFRIVLLVNGRQVGKAGSLNRAFDAYPGASHAVVDSDDVLLPTAISTIRRRVDDSRSHSGVGAIFFSYIDESGRPLGGPEPGEHVVAYRSEFDQRFGKYDGCVVYLSDVTARYRYPQFEGETYVGPTVLQLAMEPDYRMLFVGEVIGRAQYQPDGLTAAGRRLRVQNPLGMMTYEALWFQKSKSLRTRLRHAIAYWAYQDLAQTNRAPRLNANGAAQKGTALLARAPGRLLAYRWRRYART